MKLKIGKLVNSIQSCNCTNLSIRFANCCSFKFNNTKSYTKLNNNTDDNNSDAIQNQNEPSNTSCRNTIRLIYYTFFYNEATDMLSILETIFYPFVDCFGRFLRVMGWFLVCLVWLLSINMLYVFFVIIIPQLYYVSEWPKFIFNFVFGTWLAVNTFFHYTMGLITNPGQPPNNGIENIASMCRKCVAPKPARTHHCSVCKRCILKMDHHCPWFNNCIGFYNHRYFFLFCVFMTLDCAYLSSFGFHYYSKHVYPSSDLNIFSLIFLEMGNTSSNLENLIYYKLTTIEFFVMFTAGITLFFLAAFNAFIISKGATNIEIRTMRIPFCPKTYLNPKSCYDLGIVKNWKLFFGFDDLKTFTTRVLLPSTHKPLGDGINWEDYMIQASEFYEV